VRRSVRPLLAAAVLVSGCTAPAPYEDNESQTAHRRATRQRPRPIPLASQTRTPRAGISDALLVRAERTRRAPPAKVTVFAQRQTMPAPEAWADWAARGLRQVSYLGDLTWVLEIEARGDLRAALEDALADFEATALTEIRPEDRAAPGLLRAEFDSWAYRGGLLEVSVSFFAGTAHSDAMATLAEAAPSVAPAAVGPNTWTMRVSPGRLAALLEAGAVERVAQVHNPDEPLMVFARRHTGADAAQGILTGYTPPRFTGLTGRGVVVSNGEGIDVNHDDFWNHDASGARTTPRWHGCTGGNGNHGFMTAGIMLGNGWMSRSHGGARFAYRGIAPEAEYGCASLSSKPDARNWSFTQGHGQYGYGAASTDRIVRGDDPTHRSIEVGASANQGIRPQYGIEAGYYSIYRNGKNEIVVANFTDRDLQWAGSSLGPTWDGRLKPDLAAPGTSAKFDRDQTALSADIDYVTIDGATDVTWSFDQTGAGWNGGWGDEGWWGILNIDPVSQINDGGTKAMHLPVRMPPWGSAWANRPKIATLTGPDGSAPLSVDGAAGDVIRIRYRMPIAPAWTGQTLHVAWSTDVTTYDVPGHSFDVVADGAWHIATIPIGEHHRWAGTNGISYLNITFGGAWMQVPAAGNQYGGASGSSAASPVVAGAVALLLQQAVDELGVQLKDRTPSPYWLGGNGVGVPLGSTFKAILVHTARDLAATPSRSEQLNPDTGAVTIFHDGPDLASGYGLVDMEAAVKLVDAEVAARTNGSAAAYHHIVEANLDSSAPGTFQVVVPPDQRTPLKVTLAWDDPAASTMTSAVTPKLVNDLDVLLVSPSGVLHFPWTIDAPYVPSSPAEYPDAIEPEPITAADIKRARQDRRNDRDNVEQIHVEFPEAGTWQVLVLPAGLATPPQRYSLVMGAPAPSTRNLRGGSVVFVSDRSGARQLFLKPVDAAGPPAQLTTGPFAARHPAWAPTGRYIAYITRSSRVVRGGQRDVLNIINLQGQIVASIPSTLFGVTSLGYPEWSPDGRRIIVTAFDSWGERGLMTVDFAAPYRFAQRSFTWVVPRGVAPDALDATDAVFSPDGQSIYFHASSNSMTGGLFRVPAIGGQPFRLWGNGEHVRRGYQVSISADSRRLAFNSEMHKEGGAEYRDEELLDLDVLGGVSRRLSFEAGHQYGWYAKNGVGYEMAVQSNAAPGADNQIYLEENGARIALDIGDPSNAYDDSDPKWWKRKPRRPIIALEATPLRRSAN